MALYPSYSTINYTNISIDQRFKTIISNFDDLGEEKRKRKWLFPKRDITLQYRYITKAQAKTLWDFYQNRYGPYGSFNFFHDGVEINTYDNEYIGTGDGSTTNYNMPCKAADTHTIYIDGALQTDGATVSGSGNYSYTTTGGTDGADLISFVVAPNNGTRLTCDVYGYLKIHCRFDEEPMSQETLFRNLVSTGITLKGLLNE